MSGPNPQTATVQTRNTSLETQIASTKFHLASSLAQLQEILTSDIPTSTTNTATAHNPNSAQEGPQNSSPDPDLETLSQAQAIVRHHIDLVNRYNQIKDIGLGLMGLIAEKDGKRLAEVLDDFGVDEDD